jgi:hypothetical protein
MSLLLFFTGGVEPTPPGSSTTGFTGNVALMQFFFEI